MGHNDWVSTKQTYVKITMENYSTRDIYIAATLLTLGHSMINVDFQVEGLHGRPVGYFNFANTPELKDNENKYLCGNLRVEPKALFTSLKALKGMVNNVYKSPTKDAGRYGRR
jgi:hypothetical protein